MVLEKLVTKKRYDYVLEQLLELIGSDGFKIGDKLPAERIIADQTGVGRSSVREAIAVLQATGVIEVKVGDGIYVKNTSFKDLTFPGWLESPFEVLELRMCLESRTASLAAVRRTDEMVYELDHVMAKMNEAVQSGDVEGYRKLDQDFHNLIASFTNNDAIARQVKSLVELLNQTIWLTLEKIYHADWISQNDPEDYPGSIQNSFHEHQKIFEGIKNQDAEATEQAMWDHLNRVRKRLTRDDETDQ